MEGTEGIEGALARVLDAQIRALSNLAEQRPSPEAQARLLGLGLAGGSGFADDPPWLMDLLRKRVTSLYGDMRTLTGDFDLIQVAGQPGIRVRRTGEVWLGRALVLGAPPSSVRDTYGDDPMRPAPDVLSRPTRRGYRGVFLFRVSTSILPEGMGARVILPGTPLADGGRAPTAAVTAYPCQTHPNKVDLVARAVLDSVAPEDLDVQLTGLRRNLAGLLRALMPFCGEGGEGLEEIDYGWPRWDSDDGWLEDPPPSAGWPAEIDLRLSTKPNIFCLDRAAAGGLGLEGDLLLGWRAGDAIATELS